MCPWSSETTLLCLASDPPLVDTPTPKARSTVPLLCPHPLQRLGYQQLFLVRLFPGDGSGLGCTGSTSSTVGSLELLGTGPKMPAGSEPAHPWEWCPAPRNPTCRWSGDVRSTTRCLLLPNSSQEVSRRTCPKTQHLHPGALSGHWACGPGAVAVLVSASHWPSAWTGTQPGARSPL